MHYVGIDWADGSHQVAIMTEDGMCISEFVITEDIQALNDLCHQLKILMPVVVNIERPDGLLVDWLIQQGLTVFFIPPRIAARRRPHRSKDDRGDARFLAHLLRMKDEDCRVIQRSSQGVVVLGQLLQAYEQLQRQQLRNANQLRQILKQYYPTMLRLFSNIKTKIALAFLQTHPTLQSAQNLSLSELENFLRTQGYNRMSRLERIYQTIQTPSPVANVWQGSVEHVQALVSVLQTLNQQILSIKQSIRVTFNTHPEASWWQSLPGAGELTAPRLLAHIGDNRAAFPSAEVLQARAGTVPVTRQSGKSKSVRFRWACNKALRKTLMDLAHNSLRQSGWAASYHYDQLQRGHTEQRATRALANRWARIIWTLWQRREAYDEAIHLANRSKKGLVATRIPANATS